ncbi:MAG TPA: right-handed parallel beta-helix repeat-containing protein [Gammaproteobacteria bacterium]
MISKRLTSCFLVLPLLLVSTLGWAASYYVSPNGDDSNAGTSPSSPWRSIAKANSAVAPGDTVHLLGGRYLDDPIKPAKSGTPEAPIRYVAYEGEPVLTSDKVRGLVVAVDLSKRSHIVVEGIHVDGVKPNPDARVQHFVEIFDGSFNTIRDCTFRFAHGWHGIQLDEGAHHNKLLNNVIDVVGIYDDGTGQDWGDSVQVLDAEHNLLQGNTITRGAHNLLQVKGRYNVIRLNTFENDWSEILGAQKGGRNLSLMGAYNLFERNVVRKAAASTDKGENAGKKAEGLNNIVRRNFIYDNSSEGITSQSRSGSKTAQSNHIYHNTIYSNDGPAWSLIFYDGGNGVTRNVFKNNIVYANGEAAIRFDLKSNPSGPIGDSLIEGNLIDGNGSGSGAFAIDGTGVLALDEAQKTFAANFKNNIPAAPKFVSPSPQKPEDFALAPGSRGIDEGVPLTFTQEAGSGTTIRVQDAGYFFDGFSIVPGDRIQIAGGPVIQVVRVDYAANTLTVAEPVQWSANAPVSLEFRGAAPDIGAIEVGMSTGGRRPMPPGGLSSRVAG